MLVITFAIVGLIGAGFWRLIVWVREAPVTPDPWDEETARQLEEAQETCPHCSAPQPATAWFCEHCGRAVGPYNNMMPYVQIFSEGEVLRNGTQDRMRRSPLIVIGYYLLSLNFLVTALLMLKSSPVVSLLFLMGLISFWLALFRNIYRPEIKPTDAQL